MYSIMDGFETICNDERAWVRFDGGDEGDICVYARCPNCGRYLKHGKCFANLAEHYRLSGWICKVHGEIEPFATRD